MKTAGLLRTTYWRVLKPKRYGVKCLVVKGDKILLIKNSYGSNLWNLPGGGVAKRESPEDAAERELLEETGLSLLKPELLGKYESDAEGKKDTVFCYLFSIDEQHELKLSREIKKAEWFEVKEMPKDISDSVHRTLEMLSLEEE